MLLDRKLNSNGPFSLCTIKKYSLKKTWFSRAANAIPPRTLTNCHDFYKTPTEGISYSIGGFQTAILTFNII